MATSILSYLASLQNNKPLSGDESETENLLILIRDTTASSRVVFEQDGKRYTDGLRTVGEEGPIGLDDVLFTRIEISSCEPLVNGMVIPVRWRGKDLGVCVVTGKEEEYTEKDLQKIAPHIGILQMLQYANGNIARADPDLLAANVSHEIRTPLNGVIGYSQLLLQTEMSHTQCGYVNSLNQCSLQLMQIINDVLDFSKLMSGRMHVSTECFSLREVSRSVHGALEGRLKDKRQTMEFDFDLSIPEYIVTDKCKLTQIIMNLTTNAIRYSGIGSHTVVQVKDNENCGMLTFMVKDSGVGISPEDARIIFDPFVRIDGMCKSGTGLGLTIAKKLINLLGGSISVDSELGKGSTFIFTVGYSRYAEFEQLVMRDINYFRGKDVLVVDDQADNRILLTEWLFEWNANPIACASALEALRYALNPRYSFIIGLVDICMPGTTGTELAAQLKEERPFLPLIALSSIDSYVDRTNFVNVLDKPINKIQLANAMLSCCRNTGSIIEYPIGHVGQINKDIKILVAEDMDYNRHMLVNMLEVLGYSNVAESCDGVETIKQLKASEERGEPIQMLLLDLRMPGLDGFDVLRYIPNMSLAPVVVVVSASVLEEDRKLATELGVTHFLTKPLQMRHVKTSLQDALNGR